MRRLWILGILLLAFASLAFAANTHNVPSEALERQAWFGDALASYAVSGCLPTTSGTTTTGTFACQAYIKGSGNDLIYVTQPTKTVGALSSVDGTYWIAVHRDLSSAVSGWTRQAGTHYLWKTAASATQPANPTNGMVIAGATVSGCPGSCLISAIVDARVSRSEAMTGMPFVTDPLYGAACDATTDDTARMTTLINTGKSIDFGAKVCRTTTALAFSKSNVVYRGRDGGGILWDGANTERLGVVTGSNVLFEGLTLSGNEKQPSGFLVYVGPNADRVHFREVVFQKLTGIAYGSNLLNFTTALGVSGYGVTNFACVKCTFRDILKYNDGTYDTPTVGYGSATGIALGYNIDYSEATDAQPVPSSGLIDGAYFDNVQTILDGGLSENDRVEFDDGDAIRTYGDATGAGVVRLPFKIVNTTCRKVSKRCFKGSLARGIHIESMHIWGDELPYGMVSALKVDDAAFVRDVRLWSSASKPVIVGVQVQGLTDVYMDGVYLEYAKTCYNVAPGRDGALSNIVLNGLFCADATSSGVVHTNGVTISNQQRLVVSNSQIALTGATAKGIETGLGTNNAGGWEFENVRIYNGDIKLSGCNNRLSGVEQWITSSGYSGATTTRTLLEIGAISLTCLNQVNNHLIEASGINTGYVNATRTRLIGLSHNRLQVRGLQLIVPEALDTTFAHLSIDGNDVLLDGFEYTGPGFNYAAVTNASARLVVRNAIRFGSGATSKNFLYTDNGTGVYFINIVDMRPTTGVSVRVNGGVSYVIDGLASASSNADIASGSGVTYGTLRRLGGSTYALLGTANSSKSTYCTDCAVTSGSDNTCTSGGTGAWAVAINSVWRCFIAQN